MPGKKKNKKGKGSSTANAELDSQLKAAGFNGAHRKRIINDYGGDVKAWYNGRGYKWDTYGQLTTKVNKFVGSNAVQSKNRTGKTFAYDERGHKKGSAGSNQAMNIARSIGTKPNVMASAGSDSHYQQRLKQARGSGRLTDYDPSAFGTNANKNRVEIQDNQGRRAASGWVRPSSLNVSGGSRNVRVTDMKDSRNRRLNQDRSVSHNVRVKRSTGTSRGGKIKRY